MGNSFFINCKIGEKPCQYYLTNSTKLTNFALNTYLRIYEKLRLVFCVPF